jgi:hypothetical protein
MELPFGKPIIPPFCTKGKLVLEYDGVFGVYGSVEILSSARGEIHPSLLGGPQPGSGAEGPGCCCNPVSDLESAQQDGIQRDAWMRLAALRRRSGAGAIQDNGLMGAGRKANMATIAQIRVDERWLAGIDL